MLTSQITRTCYPDPELKTLTIDFCFFISSACAEYTRSLSWNTIKRHFPELNATASKIPWAVDDGIRTMLPEMHSDIHLQKDNTVLIIDAKYYSHTTQIQYNKHTLYSDNLYQIFAYVKNRDHGFGEEEHQVSGMLLYAKTKENIQTDNVYQLHGDQITVKTLDLDQKFDIIAEQLNEIATDYFDVQG